MGTTEERLTEGRGGGQNASYEYPAADAFNLSDPADQRAFVRAFEAARAHDPNLQKAQWVFMLVVLTIFAAQSGLVWWRKKHPRSYNLVTTLGLWLVPAVVAAFFRLWPFLGVWAAYSGVTAYLLALCFRGRIARRTPRLVYGWFLGVYRASLFIGALGYLLIILELLLYLPLEPLLKRLPTGHAFQALFYGLYFGILDRDCAEVAAERMAASIGARRQLAVSVRACGICQGELQDARDYQSPQGGGGAAPGGAAAGGGDPTLQLSCKHCFHLQCIRGWTIVGKKDLCPTCLEKVDLRAIYAGRPWETQNLNWMQMLDVVRYILVFNPIILLGLHLALRWMGVSAIPERQRRDEIIVSRLYTHQALPVFRGPGNGSVALLGNLTGGLAVD